jgi:hypothetical protein
MTADDVDVPVEDAGSTVEVGPTCGTRGACTVAADCQAKEGGKVGCGSCKAFGHARSVSKKICAYSFARIGTSRATVCTSIWQLASEQTLILNVPWSFAGPVALNGTEVTPTSSAACVKLPDAFEKVLPSLAR